MIGPTKENNFIWLTFALVATLVAGALTEEFPEVFALNLIRFANIAFLLIALLSLRKDGSWIKRLLIMVSLMLILVIAQNITHLSGLAIAYLLFLLFFYATAGWMVSRQVLLTGSIDINKMIGSIALYFLLGLFFSVLYTLLLHFSPDALHGLKPGHSLEHLSSTNYFSFVTLTTLGYGEIVPVTPLARVLVIVEAVTGMFYLTMVVASLVGAMRRRD